MKENGLSSGERGRPLCDLEEDDYRIDTNTGAENVYMIALDEAPSICNRRAWICERLPL